MLCGVFNNVRFRSWARPPRKHKAHGELPQAQQDFNFVDLGAQRYAWGEHLALGIKDCSAMPALLEGVQGPFTLLHSKRWVKTGLTEFEDVHPKEYGVLFWETCFEVQHLT